MEIEHVKMQEKVVIEIKEIDGTQLFIKINSLNTQSQQNLQKQLIMTAQNCSTAAQYFHFFQRYECSCQKDTQMLIAGPLFIDFNTPQTVDAMLNKQYLVIKNAANERFRTEINFDLKFQIICQNKHALEHNKVGFRLHRYSTNSTVELFTFDSKQTQKWVNSLKNLINQLGFHQQFKPIRKLGKGQFASVFEVSCFQLGNRYAVKGFSKANLSKLNKGLESLNNQIKIMRSFNHPNLQRLHSVYETQNSIYLVTQLLKGGSLFDRLQKMHKNNKKLSNTEITELMSGLLLGLIKLSEKGIVHRDLKFDNIMLRDLNTFQPVIIDFGLATFSEELDYIYYRCGTPGFVSPQIMVSDKLTKIYPISDMYSVGSIMFQLLLSKPLFSGITPQEILNNNKLFSINNKCENFSKLQITAASLLQQMLQFDPKQRISASKALLHPFFKRTNKEGKEKLKENYINKLTVESGTLTSGQEQKLMQGQQVYI